MAVHAAYDDMGRGYAQLRRSDPRIRRPVAEALGDALRVLDVGAGTGSYEPTDRQVVAIDPSATMVAQRVDAHPAVLGEAEHLPFGARSFDAAMAVLTVHHWHDRAAGYRELNRVAARRVVLTYEPAVHNTMWIVDSYVPEIAALDDRRPGFCVEEVADGIGAESIVPVEVPWDCQDGFLMAYWRRPEAFLDPQVRACTSGFASLAPELVERAVRRLHDDLRSGLWDDRFGHLRQRDSLDCGLRLVIGSD